MFIILVCLYVVPIKLPFVYAVAIDTQMFILTLIHFVLK